MGLRFFLRRLLPPVGDVREEITALVYISQGGFSYSDIMEMPSVDRRWYLRRMTQLKREEAEHMRNASKRKPKK